MNSTGNNIQDKSHRHHRRALAVATDVTHADQVKALVDAAVRTYGRIDVMILFRPTRQEL